MPLLVKRVEFTAAHYYWHPHWSADENGRIFGLCANRAGHGHDYEIEVGLMGPVDVETGMIINFDDLDPILERAIRVPLDHQNLNSQVPYFQDIIPTLENIGRYVWQNLAQADFPSCCRPAWIKIAENATLAVEFTGTLPMLLCRQYNFSAAHQLWNPTWSEANNVAHFGPCARLHGHNYRLEVAIAGQPDADTGMIIHLGTLDNLVQQLILDAVDHRSLDQDVDFLSGALSTVENVSQLFFVRLSPAIPAPAKLARLRLYESDTNWTEVTP